ncbi:hypothetical protein [Alicyclobacillus macrosporangiidus]|uniref:Tfp pilus assembly protein PilO n=1 Tax=Alicyclobacillus macrosporangiidus TaxID=392015 RepID=A0A1I7JVX6_9BACL|nr:hypothetical protein [Alicyclobacillus macrosporangiidus]SFU89341.1 hypothetical protein SAMN05421543_11243 [Alicyclobacillus macrosporangiidus]
MNLRSTVRKLLFAALALAVAGSGAWYVVESRRAAQASDHLAMQQLSLANTQATVTSLQKQLEQMKNGNEAVVVLPKSADQPGILRELENSQKLSHVTVTSAAFTDTSAPQAGEASGGSAAAGQSSTGTAPSGTAASKGSSVQVSLQVTGSTDNLLAFVHSLQTNRRVVVVKSFDISMNGQQGTMSLTLDFPYQP